MLYYNGSLGNGGYTTWRRQYIDIWDQFPSPGYYRQAGFLGTSSYRINQFFLSSPLSNSTNIQVWIDPVIYFCFRHHHDSYFQDGELIPAYDHYTKAEYHIDYLWYVENLNC